MRQSVCNAAKHASVITAITFVAFAAQAKLESGDKGEEVKTLQQLLKDTGHYTKPIDGKFGASTKDAVKKFQNEKGLRADGVVGKGTWGKLITTEETLREGAAGTPVRWLQTLIKQDGVPAKIDGKFGPGTRTAVVRIQKKHRLDADGVAGKSTWRKLKD